MHRFYSHFQYCFKFKNVYSLDIHVYINRAIYSDPFFVSTIDISNMFNGQDLWLRNARVPQENYQPSGMDYTCNSKVSHAASCRVPYNHSTTKSQMWSTENQYIVLKIFL